MAEGAVSGLGSPQAQKSTPQPRVEGFFFAAVAEQVYALASKASDRKINPSSNLGRRTIIRRLVKWEHGSLQNYHERAQSPHRRPDL